MTVDIDTMLDEIEPSIERIRAELLRCAERDIVLRRLLRGLLDAQREREQERQAEQSLKASVLNESGRSARPSQPAAGM